jgi:hypothetical protein
MSAKNTWCQQNKIIIIKNWWNSGFWMRCWSEKYINNKNLITSHFCPWSWICIINIITQKFAHDKIIGRYTKYTLQKMLLLKILYNEYYTMQCRCNICTNIVVYNYRLICCVYDLCPLLIQLWVLFTLTMRCTLYNIMRQRLSVSCVISMVFSHTWGSLHQYNRRSRYNWNTVNTGTKNP